MSTNTVTISIPAAQAEMLRAILGITEGSAPAVTTGDRARDAKGRYLPAGTAVKAPKGKAGKTARKAKKAAKKTNSFYEEVIVGQREQRAARKASNSEMAKWMRSKGLVPNGLAWEAAKHGERNPAKLRVLNAQDKAAKANA
jgi:hypothetical protein